jgi:hypothetical protein
LPHSFIRLWELSRRRDEGVAVRKVIASEFVSLDGVVEDRPFEAHNPARAESTIYRKQAGEPWRETTEGLPETKGSVTSILAPDESEPGVFYALTNLGL